MYKIGAVAELMYKQLQSLDLAPINSSIICSLCFCPSGILLVRSAPNFLGLRCRKVPEYKIKKCKNTKEIITCQDGKTPMCLPLKTTCHSAPRKLSLTCSQALMTSMGMATAGVGAPGVGSLGCRRMQTDPSAYARSASRRVVKLECTLPGILV